MSITPLLITHKAIHTKACAQDKSHEEVLSKSIAENIEANGPGKPIILEFDVQPTEDGRFAIFHDKQITVPEDTKQVTKLVSESSSEALGALCFFLDDALGYLKKRVEKDKLDIRPMLDIKAFDLNVWNKNVRANLIDQLGEYGFNNEKTFIKSFNLHFMKQMTETIKEKASKVKTALLCGGFKKMRKLIETRYRTFVKDLDYLSLRQDLFTGKTKSKQNLQTWLSEINKRRKDPISLLIWELKNKNHIADFQKALSQEGMESIKQSIKGFIGKPSFLQLQRQPPQ